MNPAIMWLIGGIGVLLLYAAYKRRSPWGIVGATVGTGQVPPVPTAGSKVG
jgi:hypothetical protein